MNFLVDTHLIVNAEASRPPDSKPVQFGTPSALFLTVSGEHCNAYHAWVRHIVLPERNIRRTVLATHTISYSFRTTDRVVLFNEKLSIMFWFYPAFFLFHKLHEVQFKASTTKSVWWRTKLKCEIMLYYLKEDSLTTLEFNGSVPFVTVGLDKVREECTRPEGTE